MKDKDKTTGRAFIIAEIGVNHNGNKNLLRELIKQAAACGVDACKFQTFSAAKLASASTPKVEYQTLTSDIHESHLQMLQKLEMDHEMHLLAKSECEKRDLEFISTPYDPESVGYLADLGVKKIKTASADIVDHRIHRKITEHQLEPIIALGMATNEEIRSALEIYDGCSRKPTLLHCVSNYPCSDDSLNLKCISTLQTQFKLKVGFSDHSIGSDAAVAALCLGATVIEKHFTIDKLLPGPDHKASSTKEELCELVDRIRRVEVMLGHGHKTVQDEELSMRSISRKSTVAAKHISAGEVITEQSITMTRPGGGISGNGYFELIGKRARDAIIPGEVITWSKIEIND